jgi:hypothetical protein
MRRKEVDEVLASLVEKLAALEHKRWAHWQRYMHSKGSRLPDGSLILPAELVARWEKQIDTNYVKLSDVEKESDRDQVRKYLPVIASAFAPQSKHRTK